MERISIFLLEVKKMAEGPDFVEFLGDQAELLKNRVKAPRHLTLTTRSGVGPRGAFSQVMMIGQGALSIEFGSRYHIAEAPLRKAMRGF